MRTLLKEHIVMADGNANVDFNRMVSMNETAAFLWEKVQGKDFDEAMLCGMLLDEYDVTEEVARRDVAALVAAWKDAGLIEE